MIKIFRPVLLLLSFFAASACAHVPQIQSYPYQHKMFDYRVAWKTDHAGNSILVDGILQNERWAHIYSVDVTIYLLKRNGTTSSGMDIPVPQSSSMGESVPFEVFLKNSVMEQEDQLEFLIHYKATEGQDGGIDWRSSFRVNAVTGKIARE